MSNFSKAQYLQAMQIPQWRRRKDIVPTVALAETDETPDQEVVNKLELVEENAVEYKTEKIENTTPISEETESKQQATSAKLEILKQKIPAPVEHEPVARVEEESIEVLTPFAVQGSGNEKAECIVLGAVASADADSQAFSDDEMVLLVNMLKAIELDFEQVFNVKPIECLASALRDAQEDEIQNCKQYLLSHIEAIQPKVLLVMNQLTAQVLLDTQDSLNQMRGKTHALENVKIIVTYPPSHLLKKSQDKRKAWEDLKMVKKRLKE